MDFKSNGKLEEKNTIYNKIYSVYSSEILTWSYVIDNTETKMHKEIFLELMRKYTEQEDYIMDCWAEIYMYYSSESRYYHNRTYVNNMLSELKSIKSNVNEYDSLLFSIYYHDIIYNTSNSDNEHSSAMLFISDRSTRRTKGRKMKNV